MSFSSLFKVSGLAAGLFVFCVAGLAAAADTTWTGAVNSVWDGTTVGNWSDGVPTAERGAVFPAEGVANGDIAVSSSRSARFLSFPGPGIGGGPPVDYTISLGGIFQLRDLTGIYVGEGSGAHIIDVGSFFRFVGDDATAYVVNDSANPLTLDGRLHRTGGSNLTIEFDGAGTVLLTGGYLGVVVDPEVNRIRLAPTMTGMVVVAEGLAMNRGQWTEVFGGTLVLDGTHPGGNYRLWVGGEGSPAMLTGRGRIGMGASMTFQIRDQGVVAPGRPGETGTLTVVDQTLQFLSGSKLRMDLAHPGRHDRLEFEEVNAPPSLSLSTDGAGVGLEIGFTGGKAIPGEYLLLAGYQNLMGEFAGWENGVGRSVGGYEGFTFWVDYGPGATVLTVTSDFEPEIYFVENGVARAVVVTADSPTPVAAYAAEELVGHIARATGVTLDIVAESTAGALDPELSRIFLGETVAAADAGIDVAVLPDDAFALRSVGRDLYVAGRDEADGRLFDTSSLNKAAPLHRPTLYGVYELLERYAGVLWLWPGELGTVVPEAATLAVTEELNEVVEPAIAFRRFRTWHIDDLVEGRETAHPLRAALSYSKNGLSAYSEAMHAYLGRHRVAFTKRKPLVGHFFTGWWNQYGAQHPEWFMLREDGQRGPAVPGGEAAMCVSNPDLHQFIVEEVWDGGDILRLGEVDEAVFCHCSVCLSWDVAADQPGFAQFDPLVSDRYARFWKTVRDLAVQVNPNVTVTSHLYWNHLPAPVTDFDLTGIYSDYVPWGNRAITYYPMSEAAHQWNQQQWLGWVGRGATVGYRPNYLLGGYVMPHLSTWQAGEMFKFVAANGLAGYDMSSLWGDWAVRGPMLYIHMRLSVDPTREIVDLRSEFFSAFGPAAGLVEEYFDYWEDYSRDEAPLGGVGWNNPTTANSLYPPASFLPAVDLLEQAETLAAADGRPEYLQRVRFLQAGLEHARLSVGFIGTLGSQGAVPEDPEALQTAREALGELIRFRRKHEHLFIADLVAASRVEHRRINLEELFVYVLGEEPLGEWHFEEPLGTPLHQTLNTGTLEGTWGVEIHSPHASRTTGDGAYRIQGSGGGKKSTFEIGERQGPVRAEMKIRGFRFSGSTTNEWVRLGFDTITDGNVVEVRLSRNGSAASPLIQIEGLSFGSGTSVAPVTLFTSNTHTESFWLAIEFDPSDHTYEIFYKTEVGGAWISTGTGATQEGRIAAKAGIGHGGDFTGQTGNEYVDVDLVRIFPSVPQLPGVPDDPGEVDGYAGWAWRWFGDAIHDPAISGPMADPDGDGIVNLLEYALGLNPLVPGVADVFESVERVDGEDFLTLTYRRPVGIEDICYEVEVSNDLSVWTAGQGEYLSSVDEEVETVTYRDDQAVSGTGRRFLRLKVEKLP